MRFGLSWGMRLGLRPDTGLGVRLGVSVDTTLAMEARHILDWPASHEPASHGPGCGYPYQTSTRHEVGYEARPAATHRPYTSLACWPWALMWLSFPD